MKKLWQLVVPLCLVITASAIGSDFGTLDHLVAERSGALVPEPSTLLLATGAVMLRISRRRSR